MKVIVDTSENGLAMVIDEITNAKSLIKLDCHDFADMLKESGNIVVITIESDDNNACNFADLCNAVREKINDVVENRLVSSVILSIFNSNEKPLMMDDISSLDSIFSIESMKNASVKWGLSESVNNRQKIVFVLKIREQN